MGSNSMTGIVCVKKDKFEDGCGPNKGANS